MRIACLQFESIVGDVDSNLDRADAILNRAVPDDLDLLVLPELAFSGYNFKSLNHIYPYLEPTASGITTLWARSTALKYGCFVHVGYPETVDISRKWPASPEYYSSSVVINPNGEKVADYRKSFLYSTDETWALEGQNGFYGGEIDGLGNCAIGICMDLNPYRFEAPWHSWEFSYHILNHQANLVILSMAWNTREDSQSYSLHPEEPDMETLSYWLARLEPVIRAEKEGEIIVVFANRTGKEDDVVYVGTSAVLGIKDGEVHVYGILGRGESELLIVDTSTKPLAKLVTEISSASRDANRTQSLHSQQELDLSVQAEYLAPGKQVGGSGSIISDFKVVNPVKMGETSKHVKSANIENDLDALRLDANGDNDPSHSRSSSMDVAYRQSTSSKSRKTRKRKVETSDSFKSRHGSTGEPQPPSPTSSVEAVYDQPYTNKPPKDRADQPSKEPTPLSQNDRLEPALMTTCPSDDRTQEVIQPVSNAAGKSKWSSRNAGLSPGSWNGGGSARPKSLGW